jgi:predicted TIM-barrel fold metal-dependent hydrolase
MLRPAAGHRRRGKFRRGVALLGRDDQLLELMLYPCQAPELALLARDFSNQTFIVNHCGSPVSETEQSAFVSRECAASVPNR